MSIIMSIKDIPKGLPNSKFVVGWAEAFLAIVLYFNNFLVHLLTGVVAELQATS